MKKIIQHLRKRWLRYGLETIVVVTGVLIAFTLNNWNENIKIRSSEQRILEGLRTELLNNKQQLEIAIQQHRSAFDHTVNLMELFNEDLGTMSDSRIDSLLAYSFTGWTFNSRHGFLKSIVASGSISHISNKQIVTLISQYEDHVLDATESIPRAIALRTNHIYPLMIEYVPLNSAFRVKKSVWTHVPASQRDANYHLLLNDPAFQSFLALWSVRMRTLHEEESELLSEMEMIIQMIADELK